MSRLDTSIKSGRAFKEASLAAVSALGIRYRRDVEQGTSIYGAEMRADFAIYGIRPSPTGIAVVCRFQSVSGTADEKLPYLVENIRRRFSMPAIILIGGGGHRRAALDWTRCQIDRRLLAVWTLGAFAKQAALGFPALPSRAEAR